ncbi:MAG: Maf family protein [Oscillospiraceae bacterium]|jgi:septum formation protein|nr:Maf family protein [Oscillospiraceae bacterium]
MRLILASASPRRRELLAMLGLAFEVIPARGDEVAAQGSPAETVKSIALGKAREVWAREVWARENQANSQADVLVIAADTLVFSEGGALGKPRDALDAADMLARLSGREHEVYTGFAVLGKSGRETREVARYERTVVRFRELRDDEIAAYVATGEPLDKAGAYGAQGLGALFIERLDGDFFNVMGLPLCALAAVLRDEFNFNVLTESLKGFQ